MTQQRIPSDSRRDYHLLTSHESLHFNSMPKTSPTTLAAELLSRIDLLSDGEQFWIGLAGAPGSGKSTLAKALQSLLPDSLLVIPMDGYHWSRQRLSEMEDPATAYALRGAPFTFDSLRFVADLQQARIEGHGCFPAFEHGSGDPVEEAIFLRSHHRVVLVEGNYVLLRDTPWNKLQGDVFDETWFLDVPLDECRNRIIQRHISVGRSLEEAVHRVDTNDGPNGRLVVEHSRPMADRLITPTFT